MSREEAKRLEVDHFVNDKGVKIVCTRTYGNGRVHIFRIYGDGRVELYENSRFAQLPEPVAEVIRTAVERAEDVPVFSTHNGGGLI